MRHLSIKQNQIKRKTEEIIKSYLFRGRYPTFQTITFHLANWLREHTPGAPTFNPLKVFRKEKSSSEKYNKHIQQIANDINDAYTATIQQATQIMSDFDFIETERGKLLHELAKISKEIDELLLISENADFRYFDGYTIGFEDMSDVNKEESNVFVDLKHQQVTLAENASSFNRVLVDTKNVSFHPLGPAKKHSALESLKNAFDDNINSAWWHVVKTDELPAENAMKAELVINFNQIEEINSIEYVPHHSKPVYVSLEYTLDGSSYTPINQNAQTDKITGTKIWDFQQIQAKGIKLIFHKEEYDERSGGMYNYYFGAKHIGIYKKNYLSKGILYTNPITFDKKVHELSMIAKNDIPFNADIRYEVALYEPDKLLEELIWHPISSYNDTKPKYPKVVNLSVRETMKVEARKAEPTGEIINGMQVFKLLKDNGEGVISEKILDTQTGETKETFDEIYNPKLFRGINQWKRERTYIPFTGQVPLNSMWDEQYRNRPEAIRTDYINKGNELDLSRESGGFNDNFYRFTICVYSDEPRNEPLSLSVMATVDGKRKRLGAYSVYVNNQRLAPVNDEVTMPFIKGWNKIEVLYHWGDMQERKDTARENLPTKTVVGKFNFFKEPLVRGDYEYMQYVDVHSLFHNISPNNHNYFAIHERQVVLNYFPQNCVFQLVYEQDQEVESHNQVVLRAHLERDINVPHVTPKIYQIQLRAK